MSPNPAPANHITATVVLNGTPYPRIGPELSPVLEYGSVQEAHLDMLISELASVSLPTLEQLVEWLKERGATDELIAVCSEEYRVGEIVSFDIHFPRGT